MPTIGSDMPYLLRDRGLLEQAAFYFAEQLPLLAAWAQVSLQNLYRGV